MILCLYDKVSSAISSRNTAKRLVIVLTLCLHLPQVQRVRNKWKCVLKDGVASIDGRDYVFSKLASEMEW